jgi:hypothetical protein
MNFQTADVDDPALAAQEAKAITSPFNDVSSVYKTFLILELRIVCADIAEGRSVRADSKAGIVNPQLNWIYGPEKRGRKTL